MFLARVCENHLHCSCSFHILHNIPLFSSKYQILSKCRFQIFQLVVSGLILVPIRQPVLNLFWFLTKVQFAYVLLGVDETFYRDQISACTCVPVSMKYINTKCIVNVCSSVLNYDPNVTMSKYNLCVWTC